MATYPVDINETQIFESSPELLDALLRDHTLSNENRHVNIFWATDNYAELGKGFQYHDQITIEAITGEYSNVIVPRALKSRLRQQQRSRDMAEVFTPSWICNRQNNLVDAVWFGREGVFNKETDNPDGTHSWITNAEPIIYPEGKTWRDYVSENRLEITCGEAPYIVSRYDTVTGRPISVENRIGLLDRKLRVVNENTGTVSEWLEAASEAVKSIYAYEWQGDNLLLAREALLITIVEYFDFKFHTPIDKDRLIAFAEIISWNVWQMDGLKGVIPNSCVRVRQPYIIPSLFEDSESMCCESQPSLFDCPGCRKKNIHLHNGDYCMIMDWEKNTPIKYVSLLKHT